MGYVFLMFILLGIAFIVLFHLDEVIAHKGKKKYLIASVFDGYCLRNLIIKAYNKNHALEKISYIKYIKEVRGLHYIPETKLENVLRIYALNGGIVI